MFYHFLLYHASISLAVIFKHFLASGHVSTLLHSTTPVPLFRHSTIPLFYYSVFCVLKTPPSNRLVQMQQHLCKCVSADCVWAVCSFNLINFAVALLSFKVILDESCNCFGFDISFALERIEVFLGEMPRCSHFWTHVSLYHSNAGSFSFWHPTLYALSWMMALLLAILFAPAYSVIPPFCYSTILLFRIPCFEDSPLVIGWFRCNNTSVNVFLSIVSGPCFIIVTLSMHGYWIQQALWLYCVASQKTCPYICIHKQEQCLTQCS